MSSSRAGSGQGLAGGSASLLRERDALRRLGEVSRVRHLRLMRLRAALAGREREWDAAMLRQQQDRTLLDEQRAAASLRWKSWRDGGGTLAEAARLRDDRELLNEVAGLLAQRHGALMRSRQALDDDLAAWTCRWQAAQVFDGTLAGRRAGLRALGEVAAERQRDEEALLAHGALQRVAAVPASSRERVA